MLCVAIIASVTNTAIFLLRMANPAELDGLVRTIAGQHCIEISFAEVRFIAAFHAF